MVRKEKPTFEDFDTVQRLSVYREFHAEFNEILKHKWLESEKAGYDVGFDWARIDWIIHHQAKWRKWRREQLRKELNNS
ncbi:MAG TPA: hypothetical protein PLW02_11680 [Verrucomicrobiota bacterium]|nr:hypothetical protein [Verrucomicrobiota bacterium]